MSKKGFIDPIKEAQAVAALRESVKELDADNDLLSDTIEGETSLFEVVDLILDRIREDDIAIQGIEAVNGALSERKRRHEEARKRNRAILEQAMVIAGVDKIARPTATLSLSYRAPALVVTEEADIPSKWWKSGAPTLDRQGLTDALKQRAKVLEDQNLSPEAKAAALADLPQIPGAELSNGAPSITIRTK